MSYVGKNPKFNSMILDDSASDSVDSPKSGSYKLINRDGRFIQVDSTGAETEIGGSGLGEVNFITNGDAETGTDGWATYADAAGTTPVDGTGGTANITFARQSSTVLRGTQTFKITKDAANRQGEGVSYAFSIGEQDVNRKCKIQFDFKSNEDAAYAAGDLTVYVYDVTNSTLITPVDTDITDDANIFTTSFNTTSSQSYRLIFHIASTNASAWDVYLDNVIVGPGIASQGAAIGEWESFTPSIANFSGTLAFAKKRRVGSNMEIVFRYTNATTSGNMNMTIPDGLNGITSVERVGALYPDGAIGTQTGGVPAFAYQTSTSDILQFYVNGGIVGNAAAHALSSDTIGVMMSVPISEWTGKGTVPMLAEDNLSQWQSYTPTVGGITVSNLNAYWRRVGDSMEVKINADWASNVSGSIDFTLPGDYTTASWVEVSETVLGNAIRLDAGTGYDEGNVVAQSTSIIQIISGSGAWSTTVPTTWATGDKLGLTATIPISQWSGSQNSLVGFSLADKETTGLAPAGVFEAGIEDCVTLQERSTNPSDPVDGTEGRIYIKGNLLILQFNDSGTVRYKYLDLTGTGVTWVHTTSAP